jgi:hypothetical protein
MQEGAGSLLLLAAAHETGLLSALSTPLPCASPTTPPRLARMLATTARALLLTLLFLPAVGQRSTWDLRSYTGTMLALLTGRLWAYGYRHVERFLGQLACAGGAELLTDALAQWTARLWLPHPAESAAPLVTYYIDGHRKPVYTDERIPRGLIGRTGAIVGCRALVLLHDDQGHPLLITTHRGETHLTIGVPQITARYTQASGRPAIERVVIDREGMGGDFLATLVASGCTVITLLRSDQFHDLTSFRDVGPFVPLTTDRFGTVVREVAAARFALAVPSRPAEPLLLHVALVRDLGCATPVPPSDEDDLDAPDWVPEHERWLADLPIDARGWWQEGWVATAAPAAPTQAKLIPIVSTAEVGDALTLARLYMARWPQQENIIRDWLLPLGLDTNHGYTKTAVEHSEVAKQRQALSQRRDTLVRWADGARERGRRASARYHKRWKHLKERGDELYRALNAHISKLGRQGVSPELCRLQSKAMQRLADAELLELRYGMERALRESNDEHRKLERYCREQRTVLRSLEDLTAREQQMYELNNDKDQVMTVCKVALTNLAMWTRDRYFPPSYAQATWKRLEPFFKLPGQIVWERDVVRVTFRPFNDRQLNRDLAALCERVGAAAPQLPDGRRLLVTIGAAHRLSLDVFSQ